MRERGQAELLSALDGIESREAELNDLIEKLDEDLAFLERDRAMYETVLDRIERATRRKVDAEQRLEDVRKERTTIEDALAEVFDPAAPADAPEDELPRAA